MNWRELLTDSMDQTYFATEKLLDLVDDNDLTWKPSMGENWMNMGQLILHIGWACGFCQKGFVTGDWSPPKEAVMEGEFSEEMMPSAEQMPAVKSVADAKTLLEKDKQLAYQLLEQCTDEDLESKRVPAPWDPREFALGQRMLEMNNHLNQHKGQLFYYLKLQGKPVNTMHLWGFYPEEKS